MDLGFPSDSPTTTSRRWRRRRRWWWLWSRRSTSSAGNVHSTFDGQRQKPDGASRRQSGSAVEVLTRYAIQLHSRRGRKASGGFLVRSIHRQPGNQSRRPAGREGLQNALIVSDKTI